MKEVVKKIIISTIDKVLKVLETEEKSGYAGLKQLSDEIIEDVALHKDLDLISMAVLVYSLYKVSDCAIPSIKDEIYSKLRSSSKSLKENQFRGYNQNISKLYSLVRSCSPKIKEHLQDVMQAAKVKKGTVLLQKGLSIGQAAGLMGLSNWDLQQYAGGTSAIETTHEVVKATLRLKKALQIFGVQG